MSATNCINCGGAKEQGATKCPFCGTTYFDISAIDFDSGNPIALTCVMPGSRQKVMMLTIPQIEKLNFNTYSRCEILTSTFSPRASLVEQELALRCKFTAVEQKDGTICKVVV